jgi:hypothetical protein
MSDYQHKNMKAFGTVRRILQGRGDQCQRNSNDENTWHDRTCGDFKSSLSFDPIERVGAGSAERARQVVTVVRLPLPILESTWANPKHKETCHMDCRLYNLHVSVLHPVLDLRDTKGN